jgi:hypothetical protein
MSDTTNPPARQPYTTPTLVTYGDAATLTQNSRGGPMKDGGTKSQARTR